MDLSSALKRVRSEGDGSVDDEDDVGLRPVCLANPGLSYSNYSGLVTGWGTTEEGGSVANTLQEVGMNLDSGKTI